MIRFTVYNQPTRRMSGIGKTSQKPYDLTFQTVYAHTVDRDGVAPPVPEKLEVILEKDAQPYAPGDYTLHPSAVYVDRDGKLQCSPRLVPVKVRAPV